MHRSLMLLALTAVCSLVMAGVARADDDPSFKKRGDSEKAFVHDVGVAVIKAAHSSAKKVEMLSYEFLDLKADRKNLKIKMEYFGKVTGRRYLADVVLKLDVSNKDVPEVLNIEYEDTNNGIGPDLKKIQALVKKLNK